MLDDNPDDNSINSYLTTADVEVFGYQDAESWRLLDSIVRQGCFALWSAAFGDEFGDGEKSILAPHHQEAILWHWESRMAFIEGRKPDYWSYFPIWSRGHMKSTIARRVAVIDALLSIWAKQPAYVLYVSRNGDMVGKHSKSIETLIASDRVKTLAPTLSKAKKSEAGASKGYSEGLLNTLAGVIFHFGSLEEGLAGGNVDDVRPTVIILDDIDGREKSVVISEARFQNLTTEILPMRQSNTLVFFAQNLINRFSVMYRIQSGNERVLTGRKPTKPVPALIDPVWTEVTVVENGITIIKDVLIGGVPTWHKYNLDRCNEEVANGGGKAAFLAENQHDIKQTEEGRVHKKYHDSTHAISLSQFAAVFGSPDAWKQWYKVAFSDWARTKTKYHANVAGYIAVSSQNTPFAGASFVIPYSFPEETAPEDVAVRFLSELTPTTPDGQTWQKIVDDAWKRTNAEQHYQTTSDRLKFATGYYKALIPKYSRPVLQSYRVMAAVNSHSEDKVRDLFNEGFGFNFVPANPANTDALEDIDEAQRIDFKMPHRFKHGEMGFTRFYVLCPDDTSQEPVWIDGIEVFPPVPFPDSLDGAELHNSDLFRFQMVNRRYADPKLIASGEDIDKLMKLFDDFGQALQMVYFKKLLSNIKFSKEEMTELSVSPKVRQVVIDQMPDSVEKDMTIQRRKFELEKLNKQNQKKQVGHHQKAYARR